ncbi:MAG: endo-1,4-beta-xylanase [Opitutae bacterium]|nr:endo-1,4-beta-xylanase [Opitutae bacterium]
MRLATLIRRCTLCAGLSVAGLWAQTPLPPGDSLLPADPLPAFQFQSVPDAATPQVTARVIEAAGPGFQRALRLEVVQPPRPANELRCPSRHDVQAGDVVMLRFFARTIATTDETGHGRLLVAVRRTAGGSELRTEFSVGPAWQELLLPFTAEKDSPDSGLTLGFDAGVRRQTLEIGGIELLNYRQAQIPDALPRTRFTYAGREPDAAWRRDALARIARLRQGDFRLRFVDSAGRPLSGATVRVEQTRSAFHWGTAVRLHLLASAEPDHARYREKLCELFNAATDEMGLKWYCWLGERGPEYAREPTLAGLHWLRERNFHVRGHVFVWPSWKLSPRFVQDLRGTPREREVPALVLQHIRDLSRATRGLLQEWDVVNETFAHHDYMDLFGPAIMTTWFATAQEELPGTPLYFNDYSNHDQTTDPTHVDDFEATARFLLQQRAPLHGLGLQAHFGTQPSDPVNLLATLDRYAALGLSIRFTEFDVWTDDEPLQADFTRDFLILAYSHPNVVGVQHWGFWEKAHWRPSAAMFRADWSEKPSARAYRDLVLNQWRTRMEGRTDADGVFTGRGFYGDYRVVVQTGGQSAEHRLTLAPDALRHELAPPAAP